MHAVFDLKTQKFQILSAVFLDKLINNGLFTQQFEPGARKVNGAVLRFAFHMLCANLAQLQFRKPVIG